jgi:NAD(P)-dependent dehydrogenase (short-subunit alcohol dehydrogenase family)
MFDFSGRHVVITGAGGGIGRALVRLFVDAGAQVSAIDRDADLLAPLEADEKLLFDLRDAAAIQRELTSLVTRRGAADILISNAGFTRAETFADVDDDAFTSEIDINLTAAYRIINVLIPGMVAKGSGAIVAVASVNALAHFGNPAYSAAKAGLLAFIRAVAVEYGAAGIRANCVCPGSVMTPAWDHRLRKDPGLAEDLLKHYPLGRLVTAIEVANAIAFLASPFASGVTGTALTVDAGLTAGNFRFIADVLARA